MGYLRLKERIAILNEDFSKQFLGLLENFVDHILDAHASVTSTYPLQPWQHSHHQHAMLVGWNCEPKDSPPTSSMARRHCQNLCYLGFFEWSTCVATAKPRFTAQVLEKRWQTRQTKAEPANAQIVICIGRVVGITLTFSEPQ
jgi:hypothetical protein